MDTSEMNSPQELIEDIRNGKMVILIDDENRENEGDLVLASDFVTPEKINFMIAEARGLVCLALTEKQVNQLNLHQMVPLDKNSSSHKTAFTVSIEAKQGVSTGISAADRAQTIRIASHPNTQPEDISTPGHIFPIRAQDGGILKRAGHTEGSVDLARLAGLNPAAVICEIMNSDGTMARVDQLQSFAKKHKMKIGTIVDLIKYRLQTETYVHQILESEIIDTHNESRKLKVFKDLISDNEHFAVCVGKHKPGDIVPVRMHSQNIIDDLLGGYSKGQQRLQESLKYFDSRGQGVLVYIRKPENLRNKYTTPQKAFSIDDKNYGIGAQILKVMGLEKIELLTDSPKKMSGLKAFGIEVKSYRSFSSLNSPREPFPNSSPKTSPLQSSKDLVQ